MKFEIGKLYRCPYSLLIYPSKTKAEAGDFHGIKLRSERKEIFMLLESDGNILHTLFGEKQGWVIYKDWLDFQPVSYLENLGKFEQTQKNA